MKRKIIINILILAGGILLGWLLFGLGNNSSEISSDQHNHEVEEQIYTCSMHPQIKNPGPGDCPLCGMDLIPLDNNSNNNDPAVFSMGNTAMQLANIQTSRVRFSNPAKEILLQGKVEVDETKTSSQSVHYSGRVEKLYVSFRGEQVKKGQKLATIYSPELVTAQKELLEAKKSQESNPKLLASARKKLRLWKVSEARINKIEETGNIYENFDIYAEVSGFVNEKKISVGDYLKGGQIIFEIINLDEVWVKFDAYEADIGFVHLKDTIRFDVSAFPNQEFTSLVNYIDPLIDNKNRTISIRTEVDNPGHLLKPEMFVYGRLEASLESGKALVVPKSAVMWTGERSIVYVKLPDYDEPTFSLKEVKLGESLGQSYIIRSGLQEDEEIVTNGTFTVDAAAQLNNKFSMMNKPETEKEDQIPDFTSEVPEIFSQQLEFLLQTYLGLKQAMVNTDPGLSQQKGIILMNTLSAIDKSSLNGEMLNYWNQKQSNLHSEGQKIAESENMELQRTAFKPFSAHIIEIYTSFGVSSSIYIQYCPMADNDKGGFWLSDKKEIENPYFGDLMMECGEVTSQLY